MDRDGGLSERERQDAEREADHQVRRDRLAGETVSREETTETKPKSRSRSRAKSSKNKS